MDDSIFTQNKAKKNNNDNVKSTIKSMLKKVPGDLIKKKIILRQTHLNNLLHGSELFEKAEVKVMEGYLSFRGIFSKPPFKFTFHQKIMIDQEICPPNIDIHMKNDNNQNLVRINLDQIGEFDKYLSYQNNIKILKELTLDSIDINCGYITLSSVEKIDINVKEAFINKLLQEELVGKYGLKMLNINLEDGYLRVKGEIVISDQVIRFDKNIKITHVDLYDHKYIEMELVDQEFIEQDISNDKITTMLQIGKIKKVVSNKVIKFLLDKIVFNKNIKVKFDKCNEMIIFILK